ncbi:calcium-binding protein [Cypionkella sp.]|uniref:calcium-binding protein n=1 Tax=Cypionkella sp. TaxID=2811411 RepID=UPI002617FA4F|nr:calcium-binding protein [Cypionkella sp.]
MEVILTKILYANDIGADTRATLSQSGESLTVLNGVTIGATSGDAIELNGNAMRVTVNGSVFAANSGITVGDQKSSGDEVFIGRSGSITAGGTGGVTIFNAGTHVTNLGEITGDYAAIYVAANAGNAVTILNDGTMFGGANAIYNSFSSKVVITNTGSIFAGSGHSFASSDNSTSQDIILNRGSMTGDIMFALGDDTYDGRGGTIDGTVYGGGGSDTFIAGLSEETFDGGAGTDILDFSKSGKLTVSLANGIQNTGAADGDTYTGIENVKGSLYGDDKIYGDAGANALYGQGGNDVLSGGAGKDRLVGGVGTDALTGGMGDDSFVFTSTAESGDKITDFSAATGNNDIFQIKASAFGGGLTVGALDHLEFQVSNGHVAANNSIRFIFDTADTTLWFDANGKAAGGLTMVADLQANAVMGFADIMLV